MPYIIYLLWQSQPAYTADLKDHWQNIVIDVAMDLIYMLY